MDAYRVSEARHVQILTGASVLNGLVAFIGPVPEGKVWNILSAILVSTLAETQDYWFTIRRANVDFMVTLPVEATIDLALSRYFPMLREGMELKLFPGECLYGYRDAAAVGSTMTLYARMIESDLPAFDYIEPQKVLSQKRRNVWPSASPIGLTRGATGAHESEVMHIPPAPRLPPRGRE